MSADLTPNFDMLSKMLDSLDAAAYVFDKNRKVIYANKASALLTNIKGAGSALGAAEDGHFEHNQYFDEEGNRMVFSPSNPSMIDRAFKGEETRDLILEHRNSKARTHRWLRVSCVPVMDAQNNFLYGIITHSDVSESKNKEHQLNFLIESSKILSLTTDFKERLRQKAKLAIPTLADWCAVDILNGDGSVERVALVHRDPSQVEFVRDFDRKYRGFIEASTKSVIESGKPTIAFEFTDAMVDAMPGLTSELNSDIKKLHISSTMQIPIGTAGKYLGAFTAAYAESGRQYTQDDVNFFVEFCHHLGIILENSNLYNEIRQKDLIKDAFLAALSHELRNPLAPIRSALELLRLTRPDVGALAEIDVIEHQFGHMTRLINDLLDVSRFVRGTIDLNLEPVELTELVAQVSQAVRPLAEGDNKKLEVHLPNAPMRTMADRTRLEQALSNLLHNSIKFTPRGGSISVDMEQQDGVAAIILKDTGVGITPLEMPFIFEPFYRSERMKSSNRGLGLGLRLVHEIARLHGGSIDAQSAGFEKGSIFTFTIPIVQPE